MTIALKMTADLIIAEKKDDIVTSVISHLGELFCKEPAHYNPGFFNGEAGIILFLYYYCHYYCSADYYVADKRLNMLLETLERDCIMEASMAEGIIGVSLVLSHLCRKGFISELDYLPEDLIDCVFDYTSDCLNHYTDELLYGAGGGLFLLLYEWEYSQKPSLYDRLASLSDLLFSRYEKKSHNDVFPRPFDTGIAHGYASWLIIISRLVKWGIRPVNNQVILDVLKKEYESFLTTAYKEVYFPRTIMDRGAHVFWKRFGWCTGDLSCLAALLQCYQYQNEKASFATAREMLKQLARRFDPFTYKVHDEALCHGASGLHVLFYSMNKLSPCHEFSTACDYWFNSCIKQIDFCDDYLGFRRRYYDKREVLVCTKEIGVLEGLAGIGLAFISRHKGDYDWKELFLLGNE